jgi:hypothetical protein
VRAGLLRHHDGGERQNGGEKKVESPGHEYFGQAFDGALYHSGVSGSVVQIFRKSLRRYIQNRMSQ